MCDSHLRLTHIRQWHIVCFQASHTNNTTYSHRHAYTCCYIQSILTLTGLLPYGFITTRYSYIENVNPSISVCSQDFGVCVDEFMFGQSIHLNVFYPYLLMHRLLSIPNLSTPKPYPYNHPDKYWVILTITLSRLYERGCQVNWDLKQWHFMAVCCVYGSVIKISGASAVE